MTGPEPTTLPAQPSDPALFEPLSLDENNILSYSPDVGLVQAVRCLSAAIRAVAGNQQAAGRPARRLERRLRGPARQPGSQPNHPSRSRRQGYDRQQTPGTQPVQGPSQPTRTDLIWATASSQAALDDSGLSAADRLNYLEAEAATYTAAAHLGVDGGTPEHYAAELARQELAASTLNDSRLLVRPPNRRPDCERARR